MPTANILISVAAFGVALLAYYFVVIRHFGNPKFWLLAARRPDHVYRLMRDDQNTWSFEKRGAGEIQQWTGPFWLFVPSIGKRVKFYGRSDLLEGAQAEIAAEVRRGNVDIKALEKQFSGKNLAELILHHLNRQSPKDRLDGLNGLLRELPISIQLEMTEFVDTFTTFSVSAMTSILSKDSGEFMRETTDKSVCWFRNKANVTLTSKDLFNIFNIVIMSLAYYFDRHPDRTALVRQIANMQDANK